MSKKIKILRVLNRLNLGGPTYNVSYLTKFISPKYETLLISGKKLKTESSSRFIVNNIGVKIKTINNFKREVSLLNDFKVLVKLIKIIKKYKPKIIHTHASKAGFLGRIAGIFCGTKIMFHTYHGHVFHSYFGFFKTKVYILIEKLLSLKTNKLIVLSKSQKKELCEGFKISESKKFKIINLGFDIKRFHISRNYSSKFIKKFKIGDHKTICAVGRLTQIKNIKYLLDITSILINKKKIKVKLIIVGDGDQKNELFTYSKKLKLNTINLKNSKIDKNYDVIFTSWIKKIEYVYPSIDLVCNTSLNEGTPLSLLEAMASKRPVISSDVGGVKDIIKNGYNGYCFNIKDKNKMIKKIKALLNNKKERIRLGNNGYKFVKNNYTYQKLVNDMQKLYESEIKKYY